MDCCIPSNSTVLLSPIFIPILVGDSHDGLSSSSFLFPAFAKATIIIVPAYQCPHAHCDISIRDATPPIEREIRPYHEQARENQKMKQQWNKKRKRNSFDIHMLMHPTISLKYLRTR